MSFLIAVLIDQVDQSELFIWTVGNLGKCAEKVKYTLLSMSGASRDVWSATI